VGACGGDPAVRGEPYVRCYPTFTVIQIDAVGVIAVTIVWKMSGFSVLNVIIAYLSARRSR